MAQMNSSSGPRPVPGPSPGPGHGPSPSPGHPASASPSAFPREGRVEGQLYKYTNVVKGFQLRWFLLDPSRGTLEYCMPDEKKKLHPRGCVYLAGCMIAPSEEDSQTFTVSAACGEVYKLKAADAKERQSWVNRLRQVALTHETQIARQHPPMGLSTETAMSLKNVRDTLLQTQKRQRGLVAAIEGVTVSDKELLILKATSHATIMSLEQCFAILQSIQLKRP